MSQSFNDPVMVDLETLGTSPNSVILSIGAVKFDEVSHTTHDDFYVVINTRSCVDAGMYIDEDTLEWWTKQSPQARRVVDEAAKSPITIGEALDMFNEYVSKDATVWGNGNDFDNAMLQEAMKKTGRQQKWKFYNNRCYRTMKNMFPVLHARAGMHHNALDDARYQAEHLLKILSRIRP